MQCALVKIDVAAVELNRSIERIEHLADGGTPSESGLLWVFNLAVNPRGCIRSLRFWRPELLAHAKGDGRDMYRLGIEEVIADILPAQRTSFHGSEVDQLFQIRRPTRMKLGTEMPGEAKGGAKVYERGILESFLKRRWIGEIPGQKTPDPNHAPFAPGRLAATTSRVRPQTGLKGLKEGHSVQIKQ